MPTRPFRSFAELLDHAADTHGDAVFLERRNAQEPGTTTFRELRDDVLRIAAGLLDAGVGAGTRIGLIAENCREWLTCDLATVVLGAIDVPRGRDTPLSELRFILEHSGAEFAFVADRDCAERLLADRDALPGLRRVFLMTGSKSGLDEWVADLDDLRAAGDRLLATAPDRVRDAAAAVGPDDLLTIIYTSGTTANPKGVMLTHGNVLENLRMVEDLLDFGPDDVALSLLPAWHAYERIMDYVLLLAGSRIVYSDRRRLREDLREVRPTILVAVPRVWEMLHDGILAHAKKLEGLQRRILSAVLDGARDIGANRAGFGTRVLRATLGRRVIPKILASTGGRVRIAVSGGGSLPAHVDELFIGLGLPLLNGYGLTETSPVVALRCPQDNRPGTIGRPLPGTDVEIRSLEGRPLPHGEVGVIWIRGPQVMRGYHANDEATRRSIVDGWFDSGDLGRVEPDGHIRITGRAKDTIVLAGGENVEPEHVEAVLKTSPWIDQAIVVGQDRKVLGALLVPNADHLEDDVPRDRWDVRDGVIRSEEVTRRLRAVLDPLMTPAHGIRSFEKVARFRVLAEPLTPEDGALTATLKVKRRVVHDRFDALIDEMFDG